MRLNKLKFWWSSQYNCVRIAQIIDPYDKTTANYNIEFNLEFKSKHFYTGNLILNHSLKDHIQIIDYRIKIPLYYSSSKLSAHATDRDKRDRKYIIKTDTSQLYPELLGLNMMVVNIFESKFYNDLQNRKINSILFYCSPRIKKIIEIHYWYYTIYYDGLDVPDPNDIYSKELKPGEIWAIDKSQFRLVSYIIPPEILTSVYIFRYKNSHGYEMIQFLDINPGFIIKIDGYNAETNIK